MKTTPYDKYKKSRIWKNIKKSIKDLESNQDVTITTLNDYVVGYLTKRLCDNFNFKDKLKDRLRAKLSSL